MQFDSFATNDIPDFLHMAEKEGWICDLREMEFLLRSFPQGCFVAREPYGSPVAFVNSISYGLSGWIGNLIVSADYRRNGLGVMLMSRCLEALSSSGVRTVWLTASAAGAPLYERLGFKALDRVIRMRMDGTPETSGDRSPECDLIAMTEIDRLGWGDNRSLLCREKAGYGRLISLESGFMVIQNIDQGALIGPWGSGAGHSAEKLLESALETKVSVGATFCDIPLANSYSLKILEKNGFAGCGETVLMYFGYTPDYRPDKIYSLASAGSIG